MARTATPTRARKVPAANRAARAAAPAAKARATATAVKAPAAKARAATPAARGRAAAAPALRRKGLPTDLVTLNVILPRATRDGLGQLKALMGVANQGEVLQSLVASALGRRRPRA